MTTLFYTCANKKYEPFALLFAASVLEHVADSAVEIVLESAEAFEAENAAALGLIREAHGAHCFTVTSDAFRRGDPPRPILPNSVRFIVEPQTQAEFTYICDIDIIVLDGSIVAQHLAFMERTGLPYSNSQRAGTDRLTGLHFARSAALYPLPDLSDCDFASMNDEQLLRLIVTRKGMPVQDLEWFRPVPGIHASPNRTPQHTPGITDRYGNQMLNWGLPSWLGPYAAFRRSALLLALYQHLPARVVSTLAEIDAVLGDKQNALTNPELAACVS
ncbi:MAG: hypothetical protein AB7J28_12810 [Hyphomonadaceae bacterium]